MSCKGALKNLIFAGILTGAIAVAVAKPADADSQSKGLPQTHSMVARKATNVATDLQEIEYRFAPDKLAVAANPFQFFRSFVDYFYLLVSANRTALSSLSSTWSTSGWCVGDAHPENFGVLLLKDEKSIFTVNDVDDSGPCPVALDLLRLMVSARLFDDSVSSSAFIKAYVAGLGGESRQVPRDIKDLFKKSRKRGTDPNPKKIPGEKFIRGDELNDVPHEEAQKVAQALQFLQPNLDALPRLLDVVSRKKVGGGSGGLLRYQVLWKDRGQLVHLELKQIVDPAVTSVATGPVTDHGERVMKALRVTQGDDFSKFYRIVRVDSKQMLVRPRFGGNVDVELDKVENFSEVAQFEAYQLGLLHGRSVSDVPAWKKAVLAVPAVSWESDVGALAGFFERQYRELKAQ